MDRDRKLFVISNQTLLALLAAMPDTVVAIDTETRDDRRLAHELIRSEHAPPQAVLIVDDVQDMPTWPLRNDSTELLIPRPPSIRNGDLFPELVLPEYARARYKDLVDKRFATPIQKVFSPVKHTPEDVAHLAAAEAKRERKRKKNLR
jgi:hypothetical protein